MPIISGKVKQGKFKSGHVKSGHVNSEPVKLITELLHTCIWSLVGTKRKTLTWDLSVALLSPICYATLLFKAVNKNRGSVWFGMVFRLLTNPPTTTPTHPGK